MPRQMDFSNKNSATETFDRIQKVVVPIIVVVAAVFAIWRNDVSIALFPVALIVAVLYLTAVAGGVRLIRSFGLKLLDRRD